MTGRNRGECIPVLEMTESVLVVGSVEIPDEHTNPSFGGNIIKVKTWIQRVLIFNHPDGELDVYPNTPNFEAFEEPLEVIVYVPLPHLLDTGINPADLQAALNRVTDYPMTEFKVKVHPGEN